MNPNPLRLATTDPHAVPLPATTVPWAVWPAASPGGPEILAFPLPDRSSPLPTRLLVACPRRGLLLLQARRPVGEAPAVDTSLRQQVDAWLQGEPPSAGVLDVVRGEPAAAHLGNDMLQLQAFLRLRLHEPWVRAWNDLSEAEIFSLPHAVFSARFSDVVDAFLQRQSRRGPLLAALTQGVDHWRELAFPLAEVSELLDSLPDDPARPNAQCHVARALRQLPPPLARLLLPGQPDPEGLRAALLHAATGQGSWLSLAAHLGLSRPVWRRLWQGSTGAFALGDRELPFWRALSQLPPDALPEHEMAWQQAGRLYARVADLLGSSDLAPRTDELFLHLMCQSPAGRCDAPQSLDALGDILGACLDLGICGRADWRWPEGWPRDSLLDLILQRPLSLKRLQGLQAEVRGHFSVVLTRMHAVRPIACLEPAAVESLLASLPKTLRFPFQLDGVTVRVVFDLAALYAASSENGFCTRSLSPSLHWLLEQEVFLLLEHDVDCAGLGTFRIIQPGAVQLAHVAGPYNDPPAEALHDAAAAYVGHLTMLSMSDWQPYLSAMARHRCEWSAEAQARWLDLSFWKRWLAG